MIEKILKAVKSSSKKRGRNITVGAVVGFLLSCTAVMGADENYLLIKKEGEEIKFSTDNGTTAGTDNPYEENTWDGTNYVNNRALNSTSNSYGLRLEGDLGNVNFTNNGSITATGSSNSYGINNERGTIGTLTNNGIITGTSTGSNGYGINNEDGTIGTLTNNGIIAGTTPIYRNSYGIYNDGGTIGTLTNNGIITGTSTSGAYGIYNEDGTIGTLTNNGVITGTSSTSIYNYSSTIEILLNNGIITGATSTSGNGYGINNDRGTTIGTLTNNGVITRATSTHRNGYGIYNNDTTIEILLNNGVITGTSTSGNGYGIYNKENASIPAVENTGIIYGKTNAVFNGGGETGKVKRTNNYGLLISGSTNVVDGISIVAHDAADNDNEIKNYGLAFTDDGSGSYKNHGASDANHNFGKTWDAAIDGVAYKIRNVEADVNSTGGAITNIKSFKIEGGELYSDTTKINDSNSTSNVILNGITDTLLVSTGENKLDNSVINAYGTAVKFDEANGGKLTLSGITVNGGIDGISAAIFGSDDSSNTDALVLENSVVNGNIDMQSGTNTITAGNNTTINGDVKGGAGEDTFTSGNNVAINGKIELGDGNNKITLGNNVYINGDVDMGANGVNLTGGSEVYLNGKVAFTDNVDILTLGEKSVIVQDIAMKDGNDELTIGAGSIVNGKLDGGDDDDTLTFGTNSVASPASITKNNTKDSINISHDIAGFENINVGTKVTFASDLSITGANNIALEKDGVLLLTLDKSIKSGEKLIGHALYNLRGTTSVSSTGGKILLDLDGATGKEIISFGNTNLESSIVPGDNETLDITSKVHTIKAGANPNEVVLVLRWSIPEILKYKGLNEVYHGIGSVNDLIGNFNIKSDEQLVTFIEYLNNIYAGNPYSYSSELSRKSAGMFRDIVTENNFKPETNKWMIYGGLTHVDGGTKDTYYGKGYYTYDIGSSDMDADTKITGAYMLGEYGISDTLTSGVVIGGNKLKSDLSNGSKVDGSALYLGAYAKKYIGNLKVTAGAGFQYGDYDADRLAVNRVASDSTESVMKYSDNYNDITYDIYLNGRYSHNIGENLFLEPYGTLSYTYIDQDGANEGSKTLTIETDSKSFDYTVGKVGVDLKKVIPHEKGKSTLSAGVSYTKILDGADEEHITGRFKGGSDFDILVAHKNEHSIGLNAKYALELKNGVIFDVKGTYSIERDSHNGSGKNRTKGEWIVGAGVGYKF